MKTEKLLSIQMYRAFAALAVVFFHAEHEVSRSLNIPNLVPALVTKYASVGGAGVDLFFVISGFIMMFIHFDDFGKSGTPKRFIENRLKRIVPNYWLLTTVAVAVLVFFPSVFHNNRTIDWSWVAASYLFVPWTSQAGISVPLLGLGWTLNYEMYFYVIFSILLFTNRVTAIMLLCVIFLGSVTLGEIFGHSGPLTKMLSSWLLLEFLAGCLLGIIFKSGFRITVGVAWIFVIIAVIVLAISPAGRNDGNASGFQRFIFYGLPAMALIGSATLYHSVKPIRQFQSWLHVIGNSSYSLYLTHVFSLPFAALILNRLGIQLPWYLGLAVLVLFSILVGLLFWMAFERPVQGLFRKRSLRNAAPLETSL